MANIQCRQVTKIYRSDPAVSNVDIDIPDGEFVVVVGPSGCGKSTLLRMIAGLESITDGTVSIGGRVVNELEPKERDIAMVFQNYALYPHMTVYDNMAYGLKNRGIDKATRRAQIEKAVRILRLEPDMLTRKPRELSGGQRQRVAMGRAIVREPQVFLFDEPLSNLDAKLRVQMRIEIKRLHQLLGVTTVYVTHDQVEAMTLAQRLIVMNGGRVEQIGTPHAVYRQPASRFVATFIGSPAMNLIPGKAHDGDVVAGGVRWSVKAPEAATASARLTLGVRPEHLQMASSDDGLFSMKVELVEDLGADALVHGQLEGAPLIARLPGSSGVAIGDELPLRPAVGAPLHLFDDQTGTRLDTIMRS